MRGGIKLTGGSEKPRRYWKRSWKMLLACIMAAVLGLSGCEAGGNRGWSDQTSASGGNQGWSDQTPASGGNQGWSDQTPAGGGNQEWPDQTPAGGGNQRWSDQTSDGGGLQGQPDSAQEDSRGAQITPNKIAPLEASGDGWPGSIWNREAAGSGSLPPSYDYRENGRAPQIRNQGSLGTCWAFASLTALSASLLPEEEVSFSVDHMTMHNSFLLDQDEGGEYTMSMAYLLAWQGPVTEAEDPYGDGISPEGLTPCKHVQEIQVLPAKDYQAIKAAVYQTGGVQSSLYTSMRDYQSESVYYNRETNSYCYIGSQKPNHDSVIVGWDDHYPKENFNMELEGDGAFICTNSWGEDFGDQGYFYVSYYDSNIGVNNIVYTGVEAVDNYDHIYQTDLCGWVGQIGYGMEEAWFANVYKAAEKESLSAVGFYATDADTEYEVYIARELPAAEAGAGDHTSTERALNRRTPAVKGRLAYSGYYTIPLSEKIVLDAGEKFAIIVKIMTPGTIHPVAIEYDAGDGIVGADLSDGEGYLSHNGSVWEHVEETQSCNLCLKAYSINED